MDGPLKHDIPLLFSSVLEVETPAAPAVTPAGVWMPYALVLALISAVASGTILYSKLEARVASAESWQEQRPDLQSLILLIEKVGKHESLLGPARWSLDQELAAQRQVNADIRQLRDTVANLRTDLTEWTAGENAMHAELLNQINEEWAQIKAVGLRLDRLERNYVDDNEPRGVP